MLFQHSAILSTLTQRLADFEERLASQEKTFRIFDELATLKKSEATNKQMLIAQQLEQAMTRISHLERMQNKQADVLEELNTKIVKDIPSSV